MKTKDFMAELAKCDPEEEIRFEMTSGCCGDWESLELVKYSDDQYCVEAEEYYEGRYGEGKPNTYLRVTFQSLPGYHSCRQAGGTLQADKEYWEKIKGK